MEFFSETKNVAFKLKTTCSQIWTTFPWVIIQVVNDAVIVLKEKKKLNSYTIEASVTIFSHKQRVILNRAFQWFWYFMECFGVKVCQKINLPERLNINFFKYARQDIKIVLKNSVNLEHGSFSISLPFKNLTALCNLCSFK